MSKSRYIRDSFWTDGYIERLSPDEKLMFLYLLTNPLCNVSGIYEIRSKRIGFDTGYDTEVVENILNRFVNDGKLFRIKDYLIITNFVKNQSSNPSILQGVERIIQELPHDIRQAVTGWVQEGLLYFTLPNLTKPNEKKSSSVEKNSNEELKERFDSLRKNYRDKLSKKCGGLETEWKNADKKLDLSDSLLEKMMSGATRMYKKLQKDIELWEENKRKGKNEKHPQNFIIGFQVFINQKRWEHFLSDEEINK